MLCKQCQMKVLRHCVGECGGMIPMNSLGCDNPSEPECKWEDFAFEIVDIFTEMKQKWNKDKVEKV